VQCNADIGVAFIGFDFAYYVEIFFSTHIYRFSSFSFYKYIVIMLFLFII